MILFHQMRDSYTPLPLQRQSDMLEHDKWATHDISNSSRVATPFVKVNFHLTWSFGVLLQFVDGDDFGPAKNTFERGSALSYDCLDGSEEASLAEDSMSAGHRLDAGRTSQADDTLSAVKIVTFKLCFFKKYFFYNSLHRIISYIFIII